MAQKKFDKTLSSSGLGMVAPQRVVGVRAAMTMGIVATTVAGAALATAIALPLALNARTRKRLRWLEEDIDAIVEELDEIERALLK